MNVKIKKVSDLVVGDSLVHYDTTGNRYECEVSVKKINNITLRLPYYDIDVAYGLLQGHQMVLVVEKGDS